MGRGIEAFRQRIKRSISRGAENPSNANAPAIKETSQWFRRNPAPGSTGTGGVSQGTRRMSRGRR